MWQSETSTYPAQHFFHSVFQQRHVVRDNILREVQHVCLLGRERFAQKIFECQFVNRRHGVRGLDDKVGDQEGNQMFSRILQYVEHHLLRSQRCRLANCNFDATTTANTQRCAARVQVKMDGSARSV